MTLPPGRREHWRQIHYDRPLVIGNFGLSLFSQIPFTRKRTGAVGVIAGDWGIAGHVRSSGKPDGKRP